MSSDRHVLRVFLANLLWFVSCLPGWLAFLGATRGVKRAQTRLLLRLLRRNATTEYGERHAFASIRDLGDFAALPMSEYEDQAVAMERIRHGRAGVLTREPVDLLQPTSGSAAATKLVPYTRSLRREFKAAIDPWIASLYRAHPTLLFGRQYWSISPATRIPQDGPPAVRVGFADDADYLGRLQRALSRTLFAVPPEMARVTDPEAFEYLTLLFLLRERNLRLISVWHPSFLTVLLRAIGPRLSELVEALHTGTLAVPGALPPALRGTFGDRFAPDPARAAEVRALDPSLPDFPGRLWPRVRVVSCWTDGRPEPWLTELRCAFPHAVIQGKGLTATEGIVSFPLGGSGRKVCAVRSHFFEFVDPETGAIRHAWDVESQRDYSVVLTTGGGLYRYRLHDLVRVTGFINGAPCLDFVSRDNLVSDIVGEKLNLRHVEESIRRVEAALGGSFTFALLAPRPAGAQAGYVFCMQAVAGASLDDRQAGDLLEAELGRNFHYRHAREHRQLQPLQVFRVHGDAHAAYRRRLLGAGVRAGDIKFLALSRDNGWLTALEGESVI